MPFLPRLISFARNIFQKRERDHDLDDEVRSQLDLMIEENIKNGLTPDEARRAARIEIGGVEQLKEEVRTARTGAWLDSLLQDIRFGIRMLRKSPTFTAVAILTLALGIGANTAIFSLIDALLLRSLPVSNPEQLVFLQWKSRKQPKFYSLSSYGDCSGGSAAATGCNFSVPFFNELRSHSGIFSSLTGSGGVGLLDLGENGPATMVRALFVSGTYFETLGVRADIGRTLQPSDDQDSAPAVAVVSYGYWQRAFGGSLSVLGKIVTMNGVPTKIVGVAESRFTGLTPGSEPEVWLALAVSPRFDSLWTPEDDKDAGNVWMLILARLNPAVPRKKAEAAVTLLFRNAMLHGTAPLSTEADDPRIALVPVQAGLTGTRSTYSTPLFVLMAAVGIVLLIASGNIAGLLLARSSARQKEMAVRLALGAGRGRVIRQLLTESLLLSTFGGLLGIALAIWGARAILAFVASGSAQPLGITAAVDYRVLLFTFGIAAFAGIFFGLASAMRGARIDLSPALKGGSGVSTGQPRHHWFNTGNSLVMAQVALTMIVLVGAGLLIRTLRNLRSIDPGFDTTNILDFTIDPVLIGYRGTKLNALYREIQGRLSAIPGVASVTFSDRRPLGGGLWTTDIRFTETSGESSVESDYVETGPNFFKTIQIPLLKGRGFLPQDYVTSHYVAAVSAAASARTNAAASPISPSAPQAVLVNEAFVRRFLGNREALGQRFWKANAKLDNPGYVIVGITANAKNSTLRREIEPAIYAAVTSGWTFEVRTVARPDSIVPTVRNVMNQIDADLPITNLMTEHESIDRLLFQERFIARLSSFFGVLALALACIGLYGLLSYEVTRRTREIGIRMALGADRGNILRTVVGQGFALALAGLALGVVASLGLTRFLGSILYDVHPSDPATLLVVALILLIVALAACCIPARRAMRVDPMVALRHE